MFTAYRFWTQLIWQKISFLNCNPGLLNVSTFVTVSCLSWLHDSSVQYVKKTIQGIIWEMSAAKETEAELRQI